MDLKPTFVTKKYLFARGPQLVNHAIDITPVISKKFDAIKFHKTLLDNMLRSYKGLQPDVKLTEDEFIWGEFLKKANPKYGVEYVEEFYYIDETQPFTFMRNET